MSLSDRCRLSDEQRRLLVACGGGAGMAAAYGVPLGGALFALEVLRGALSLRLVLPAMMASLIATAVSWLVLPDAPTYPIPDYPAPFSIAVWALLAGPIAGLVSVGYVRVIAWADRTSQRDGDDCSHPCGARLLGLVSIWFPQLLGNGKDMSELVFADKFPFAMLLAAARSSPLATVLCLGSGAPGGLFTPVAHAWGAAGRRAWAMLGRGFGRACPAGEFAVVGAAAVLAATTQGPISAVVLMMELTGRDRSFIVPLLLAVVTATLVSRTIEPRSIYDARLTDEEVEARLKDREPPRHESARAALRDHS